MNENVVDVLVYLFENYLSEFSYNDQQYAKQDLYSGLEQAGFAKNTIDSAFVWFENLEHGTASVVNQSEDSVRIYSEQEIEKLDEEGVDFIMYLENNEILKPATRELLINSLLNLNADNIDVDDLQWLVLIILFSQPEEEQAFASMESLMFEPLVDHEH